MNENKITQKLVKHGQELFDAPKKKMPFTKYDPADELLNNLDC